VLGVKFNAKGFLCINMGKATHGGGGWAVVAVCKDGSETEPEGTYGHKEWAESHAARMNANIGAASRFVDRYEVRKL
jgi:hypothetical protein